MKTPLLTGYTFQPSTRSIDFSALPGFDIRDLFAVINTKTGDLIYAVANPALGYSSISGSVVTFKFNTAAMDASDPLIVLYENGDSASNTKLDALLQALLPLATEAGLDGVAANLGAPSDATANADTGTFSMNALVKRSLARWTTLLARIPVLGAALKAASIPVTIATDQSNLEPGGTAINGATLPAGGTGLTGWLSGIFNNTYNKTLFYAPTLFKAPLGNNASATSAEHSSGGQGAGSPTPFTKYFVQGRADQQMDLNITARQDIGGTLIIIFSERIPANTPFSRSVDVGFRSYQAILTNTSGNAATDVTLTDGFKVA